MIRLKILKERGYFIVKDRGGSYDPGIAGALTIEILRGFGRFFERCPEVSIKDAIDFFNIILKEKGQLKTQPFYPNKILPVEYSSIVTNPYTKEAEVLTEDELAVILLKERNLERYEYAWLSGYYFTGPEALLFSFLSSHINLGRLIGVGRKERREFMKRMEISLRGVNNKPRIPTGLWKKVSKVIHPQDYRKTYPAAASFLLEKTNQTRIAPEKPKLKTIMWKGWKEGNDFESFESYLDQPSLTIRDILISLRDYERDPRITRYKKTREVELGNKKPGQEEAEIVDLIRLQLKEKLLEMLPKKKDLICFPAIYDIPATHLLKKHIVYFRRGDEEIREIKVRVEGGTVVIYSVKRGVMFGGDIKRINELNENFFITVYFPRPQNKKDHILQLKVNNGQQEYVKFEEEAASMILLHYDHKTGRMKWIGEPGRTFYAGHPGGIEDWEEVERILCAPPTITTKELFNHMYTVQEGGVSLTIERLKRDLGL